MSGFRSKQKSNVGWCMLVDKSILISADAMVYFPFQAQAHMLH